MTHSVVADALKTIREAQTIINKRLTEPGLNQEQWDALQSVVDMLRDLDTYLLKASLKESLEMLKQSASDLEAVQEKARAKLSKLDRAVKAVESVASALDKVVEVATDLA